GVVDSLVNNIVNPVVGVLYGGGGQLVDKYWCLKTVNGVCTNKMGYGAFLNTLINFIIIAAVVYLIVRSLKLDKLDKPKG
ncbi:MAG: MscL family protein, partial [Minisyncoccia bacterium]